MSTLHSHSKKLFSALGENVISWKSRDKEGLLRFCGDIKCGEKRLLGMQPATWESNFKIL